MEIIDLRSDTVTRPGPEMRAAMAAAEVGDDVYGEDETVQRLQVEAARLLGKEAALFVPSGSMANQIALRVHCQPGDDVLVSAGAHLMAYEAGAAGALAGVQLSVVGGPDGLFSPDEVAAAHKFSPLHHLPPTRLVCVEDTHNRGGGRVWPPSQLNEIVRVARALGLATHMDGARLLNAAVACGTPAAQLAEGFDTVSLCFSKGLGAPVGSVLAGSGALIDRAHRFRKMMGGGMRQSGILAAGALYALAHNVQRLRADHENARLLAQHLAAGGLSVQPDRVETNIVLVDLAPEMPDAETFAMRARHQGVAVSVMGPRRLRLVTHLDVDRAAVLTAADVLTHLVTD